MDHLYLAVTCKTPQCTTGCLIKYLCPYSGQEGIGAFVPQWFDFRCGDCEQTHRYRRHDTYAIRTDTAPPSGFENPF